MAQTDRFPRWRIVVLGAVCGLIFSCIAQVAIHVDYEYSLAEVREIASRSRVFINLARPRFDWFIIPAVCMFMFSLASYAVHRIYAKRLESPILLWGMTGFAAGGVVFLIGFANSRATSLFGNYEHYREYGSWGQWPSVFSIARLEFALFILPILFGFIFGFIVQLSSAQYSGGKEIQPRR